MNKLICMGECIADLLPDAPGSLTYTAKAGGAPANVCTAVARLGLPAYYLGKMSNDNFGKFLLSELVKYGVKTDTVVIDGNCKTGLVVVDSYDNGERDFFFYRDTPADADLSPDEITDTTFKEGDVLHFCSVALMPSPTKLAHEKAVRVARNRGALVSFDVNARLHLWKDKAKLVETVNSFLPYCDIVKVTDEELAMLSQKKSEDEQVKQVFDTAINARLIFVTKGEKGASVYDRALVHLDYPAYPANVVDTTGAGDCFSGAIIYKLLKKEASLSLDGIKGAVEFALAACSLVISKKGAMNAMPGLQEVEKLL